MRTTSQQKQNINKEIEIIKITKWNSKIKKYNMTKTTTIL